MTSVDAPNSCMPDRPEGVLRVEVAAAWPDRQLVIEVELPAGATVMQAIERSGVQQRCPDLEIDPDRIGIFSERCRPDRVVREGDRIEIYRPLKVDPKEARRQAAEAKRSGS